MAKILIEVDDKRTESLNKVKNGPWGVNNLTNDELTILNGYDFSGKANGEIFNKIFPNCREEVSDLPNKYGTKALHQTWELWCDQPYKGGTTNDNIKDV